MANKKRKQAATTKSKRSQPKRARTRARQPADESEVILSSVPPKKGKQQAIRLTSHKARSRWFQARASWPVREAPVNRLLRERLRVAKSLAPPPNVTAEWECVGPTNIGGRVTSL